MPSGKLFVNLVKTCNLSFISVISKIKAKNWRFGYNLTCLLRSTAKNIAMSNILSAGKEKEMAG